MHDIPVIELIVSLGLFAFAAVVFLWNYNHRSAILLSDVYIWVAGVLVGLGPTIAFALGSREFQPFSTATALTYLSFFLFFCGLLVGKTIARGRIMASRLSASGRRSPIFYFIDHFREIPVINILISFVIIFGLRVYEFSVGGGISGFNTLEVQLSKSYPLVVLSHLSKSFQFVLLFFCFAALISRWKKLYPIVVPILIYFGLNAFLGGRRPMIMLIVFGGFVAFALSRKIKIFHVFVAAGSFIIVAFFLSPLFLSFRSAAQNVRATEVSGAQISEVIKIGLSDALNVDEQAASERAASNTGHRLMSIRHPISNILEAQKYEAPLFGRALFQIFTSVLPRHFRPYEGWYGSEQYIQAQYGLPAGDVGGSVPMLFVADFWVVGALFGGVFFGLYLNYGTYVAFLLWNRFPFAGMALFGSLMNLAINTEIAPDFIFLLPRNFLILTCIFVILRRLGVSVKNFEGAVFSGPPPGYRNIR